jgi:preprotein translocase subunit SecF
VLAAAGMGEAEIQRFDKEEQNKVLIKTAVAKGSEEGSRGSIIAALNRTFNQSAGGKLDLNQASTDAIARALTTADPEPAAPAPAPAATASPAAPAAAPLNTHYAAVAAALVQQRAKAGIFESWDEVSHAPGVTPAAVAALQKLAFLGDYSVVGVENVGPQIGKELRTQGLWAVALSLAGMLIYIGLRFELRFGIGAVMASIHDVLITLGLFILMRFEFNLTTIAAFLTLVGYSTNDTVVIFDRVRENMRKSRRKPLLEVMNESINQTLSRTIMTSGLTMLTVAALLALGGDVLRGFAFVMTVGIIVGTYSSVYIASPFALLWEQLFGAKSRIRGDSGAPQPGMASTAGARTAGTAPRPAQAGGAGTAPGAAGGPQAAPTPQAAGGSTPRPSRTAAGPAGPAGRRRSGRR